ncbi:hypothetical protein KJ708_11325 [bacterium]|nr:hypothetical protein [bacterium]MBU1917626.1 hypothetical protein [bacterium]
MMKWVVRFAFLYVLLFVFLWVFDVYGLFTAIKTQSKILDDLLSLCAMGCAIGINIYALFHWGSADFKKPELRGRWLFPITVVLLAGSFIYYIVVCELGFGLKKEGEYFQE